MKKYLFSFILLGLTLSGLGWAAHANAATVPASGSLIRGTSLSAVYYVGADGFRYVFPNEKTYFTWYSDFSGVTQLSDADLGRIQIGGNVTYKPAAKLVKINSDPRTYAVDENGTLRWVSTEAIATTLYGATWNTAKTDDIPDGFFANYQVGEPIMEASDFSPTLAVANINEDKDLTAFTTVAITDTEVTSETTIEEGETVLFVNNGTTTHSATSEDDTWGTGTLKPQEFFVRRFSDAGTYEFYDSYDETITGTIVVE